MKALLAVVRDEYTGEVIMDIDTNRDGQISVNEAKDVKFLNLDPMHRYEGGEIWPQGITDLSGIEYFSSLDSVWVYWNALSSIDMSTNPTLKVLLCNEMEDETGNISLTKLDVTKNIALERLCCQGNQLSSLDLTKNVALGYLECSTNMLTSLDVTNNVAIDTLQCSENLLTDLDVSNCSNLKVLSCSNNKLTALNVSNCPELKGLACHYNQITELDLSNCPELEYVSCSGVKKLTISASQENTRWVENIKTSYPEITLTVK